MTKRKRSILMAFVTMMLCFALVAGGSYALFTDQVELETHLYSGELDISLWRIDLQSKVLDPSTGFLTDRQNDEDVNFSSATSRNVFDIDDSTLIVPRCSYTATMQIENHSDVAFGYWVEIKLDSKTTTNYIDLAKQLEVTVDAGPGHTVTKRLIDGLELGSRALPIDILPVNGIDNFKVSVTFVDDDSVNNDAMNQDLEFDVFVHAVQITEKK